MLYKNPQYSSDTLQPTKGLEAQGSVLIFWTYWKAQSANCSRNRKERGYHCQNLEEGKPQGNATLILLNASDAESGNKKHLERGNRQSCLWISKQLIFKHSPLPRKPEGVDIPEGQTLPVNWCSPLGSYWQQGINLNPETKVVRGVNFPWNQTQTSVITIKFCWT